MRAILPGLLDRFRLVVEMTTGKVLVMEADLGENLMAVISDLATVRFKR